MRFVLIAIYLILIMPITGSWWAEGSNILLDPAQVCEGNTHRNNRKAKRLTGKLAEICKNDTSLMREIKRGINLGFRECENQFRNNMWNCSWTIKRSMRRILTKDTRETAFVHAITAAGITYAVTKACTMGDLVECSCQNHVKKSVQQYVNGNAQPLPVSALTTSTATGVGPKGPRRTPAKNGRKMNARNTMLITSYANYNNLPAATMSSGGGNRKEVLKSLQKNQPKPSKTGGNGQDGSWEWGGCDDNVNFGFRKSKDFLDARLRKKSDIRTLVKLHNNNAGRLAVKQFMRMECKCHGLSGSCTMRTCWMKMPPFSEVGSRLKEHFDGATKVIARNDGHSFMPDDPSIKLPTKRDLVYTEDSDDFCEVNAKTGSLGTHGRECNITSNGVDGCNLMCCERGQARKHVEVKRNCKCSFKWCCEVTCSTCIDIKEVYTCK